MTPRAAAPPSAGAAPSQFLNANIDRLKLEQRRRKTSKKQIVKELRNAERKRKRLRERARQLMNEDIFSVMLIRSQEEGHMVAAAAAGASESKKAAADACRVAHRAIAYWCKKP